MLTFDVGAAVRQSGQHRADYYLTATIPTEEAHIAAYYAQDGGASEALRQGMGTVPVVRPDVHPELAKALGLPTDRTVTREEFANLLSGLRADGDKLPKQHQAQTGRMEIGYLDLTLSAPKSVSVAWAFAPEAERHSIAQAHRSAVNRALTYIEREVAKAGFGDRHRKGQEQAHLAWVQCEHYTARETLAVAMTDLTGAQWTEQHEVGRHLPGDMALHTHTLLPNLMLTESGRLLSLKLDRLNDRITEFGATYQAFLAQELRAIGMAADLDPRTHMARMPAVPLHVTQAFSKRRHGAEAFAKEQAGKEGYDWDSMAGQDRVRFLNKGAAATRRPKAEMSDIFAWREQARALDYDPQTFIAHGPPPPPMTRDQRLALAMEATNPLLSDELTKRAVVSGGDVRTAAVRGLIHWGIDGIHDIDAQTATMRREGVEQRGKFTKLLWRVIDRRTKVTTELHRDQEQELIGLARQAQGDRHNYRVPHMALGAAIARSGLDYTGAHGASQLQAIHTLADQGRLAMLIGSAGSGKTVGVLSPLVSAWRNQGYTVWGTSLAWRQAGDLKASGISDKYVRAYDPFLKAVEDGRITLNSRSVVVIDEISQIGTRQFLDLLRISDTTGTKIVAIGDPKQCQSIEAGPLIELLAEALGRDTIPEVLTTIRQQSEAERNIVGMFRDGFVEEALAAKRDQGTAVLANGSYQQAVQTVAERYMQRRSEIDGRVTISAPTNEDARNISAEVRKLRREKGELGRDLFTKPASDGRTDSYNLPLAVGDNIRLFKRTHGVFWESRGDGHSVRRRSASIGDNGSVVTIKAIIANGMSIETAGGKQAFVTWDALKHRNSDALAISYGDCATIDSSQGMTSDWHIHAFPAGSSSVQGFKNYVAASRHRIGSDLIGSMGAELRAVLDDRMKGLPDLTKPQALDAAWQRVAENFSRIPVKESALEMLGHITIAREQSAKVLQKLLRTREAEARIDAQPALPARLQRERQTEMARQLVLAIERTMQDIPKVTQAAVQAVTPRVRFAVDPATAESQLRTFMVQQGLVPPKVLIMDGKAHYVPTVGGKPSDKAGSYSGYIDGIRPNAWVANRKTGTRVQWKANADMVKLTPEESQRLRDQSFLAAQEAARAMKERQDRAAAQAQAELAASVPASAAHYYLVTKGILPHGARQNGPNLLIPFQTTDDEVRNRQIIDPDGNKRFLSGAQKLGTYYLMGQPGAGRPLFIAEGFATAASLNEASGQPVAVAGDTSNLGPVARALKERYPDSVLAMAADNDAHLPMRAAPRTADNIGVKKAGEIAAELKIKLVIAPEIPARTAADKGTDWNDYAAARGIGATRAALREQWMASVAAHSVARL